MSQFEDLFLNNFLNFLSNLDSKEFEDEFIICKKLENGQIEITGKPIKEVFIYDKTRL